MVEVGPVRADDGGAVAAQLHHHVLARGVVHQRPADTGGAGERDDGQPFVGHQRLHVAAAHRQHREHAVGQVGLGEQLTQQQRGQRGRGRGLDDHRGADGECGRDLVRDQVQREVERCHGEHGSARHPADQRHPADAVGVGVQPLEVAGEPAGLLGGELESAHRAGDLDLGPLERLAVLGGDRLRDLLGPLGQRPGHVLQRRRPHVRGRAPELLGHRGRGRYRPFHLLRSGHGDRGHLGPVVRVVHGDLLRTLFGVAGDPAGPGLRGDRVHGVNGMPVRRDWRGCSRRGRGSARRAPRPAGRGTPDPP